MAKLISRSVVLAVLAAGVLWWHYPGDDLAAQDKGALPIDLARVSGKAAVMVSARPADLWDSELGKGLRTKLGKDINYFTQAIEGFLGLEPSAMERLTLVMPNLAPGNAEPLLYVASQKALDKNKFLLRLVPGGAVKKHAGVEYVTNDSRAAVLLDDKHFVVGQVADVLTMLDNGKAKPEGAMVPALKLAAGKHSLVVAGNPEAIGGVIRGDAGGELDAFVPLFKARLATFALDVGSRSKGQLRMTFASGADAKEGARTLELGRKMLLGAVDGGIKTMGKDAASAPVVSLLRNVEGAVKGAKVAQTGTTLAANLEVNTEAAVAASVAEVVGRMRGAAGRMQSVNNLKQIGLAMHNFHDATGAMPPVAVFDKDGKPLLSWRVLILPYVEQDGLYKEFKLNEAWDSAHNKKLLAKMPKVYQIPDYKPKSEYGTYYQVFSGKGAAFEGKKGLRFSEFTDGTSNTILVVEAGTDVPWTKPDDVTFEAGKEVPKLGGAFEGGFNATFADGSVRFLKTTIDKDALKALITRNGGEAVGRF